MDEFKKDENVKKALQRIYNNIEIPDSTSSWLKVQEQLQKKKSRKILSRRLKLYSAIVACSFIISLFVSETTPKVHSNISFLFKRIQEKVIEIFHESPDVPNQSKAKTSSPELNISRGMLEVSLDEAQNMLSFPLLLSTKIPRKFELDNIRIFSSSEGEYNNVQMEYTNASGEIINILQHNVVGKTTGLKTEIDSTTGNFKDININGNKAILMSSVEGNKNLEWLTKDRILIRVSGMLSETEIIDLANSLK